MVLLRLPLGCESFQVNRLRAVSDEVGIDALGFSRIKYRIGDDLTPPDAIRLLVHLDTQYARPLG